MVKVLHLSDLHFGKGHRWGVEEFPKLENVISALLKNNKEYPQMLMITGDITSTGTSGEFDEALLFLEQIFMLPELTNLMDILIVPGNHDFPWSDEHATPIPESNRSNNYKDFVSKAYISFEAAYKIKRTINNIGLSANLLADVNKHLIDIVMLNSTDNDTKYVFIGMNSMKIDSEKDQGKGYFRWDQLQSIEDICEYISNSLKGNIVYFTSCHHHLVPISFVERDYFKDDKGKTSKRCSITLDSRDAMDRLQKIGCQVIFHGHQHQPACIKWKNRISKENKPLNIISAGSVGASRDQLGDVSVNHCFIHNISKDNINISSYIGNKDNNYILTSDREYSTSFYLHSASNMQEECYFSQIEPKKAKLVQSMSCIDNSNLFYLFLNVADCRKSRNIIKAFTDKSRNISLCAMYDLYGKYDVVIKFRELKDGKGTRFQNDLIEHLSSGLVDQLIDKSSFRHLDVTNEYYSFKSALYNTKIEDNYYLMTDADEFAESKWTTAILEIMFRNNMHFSNFMPLLNNYITQYEQQSGVNISKIIRGLFTSRNDSMLLEVLMSCAEFQYLNKLTKMIEMIINPKKVDKSTHIIYTHQEWLK